MAIKAQHQERGKSSPLANLDWTKYGPEVDEAAEVNGKIIELEKELAKLSERRDVLVGSSISDFVRSSRDILLGLFRGEPHQMIDFGFDVSDTPRTKKPADASDKKVA